MAAAGRMYNIIIVKNVNQSLGITVFKMFVYGGILLNIWLKIPFYGSAHESLENQISDIVLAIYPP